MKTINIPSRQKLINIFSSQLSYILIIAFTHSVLVKYFYPLISKATSESLFERKIIIFEACKNPILLLSLILPLGLLFLRRNYTYTNLTVIFRSLILIFIWQFAFYDFNFYYGHLHLFDRLAILLIGLLSLKYNSLTLVFLVYIKIMSAQFNYPLGNLSWTDKSLPFEALSLIFVTNLTHSTSLNTNKIKSLDIYILLSLITGFYFYPGLEKIRLNWLLINDSSNLLQASYINNWLSHLSQDSVHFLVSLINKVDPMIKTIVLITEVAAPIIILFPRFILPMTVSFIFLHLSIYTLSGIFFWKWIILDLAFCYLFIKTNRQYLPNVKVKVLLFVLSIFCQAWSNPISLGWLDSKLVSKFSYTAVSVSGKKYSINPNYFEPYGILFAQQRFHYLLDRKVLTRTYGSTSSKDIYQYLQNVDCSKLKNSNQLLGKNYFSLKKQQAFNKFFQNFLNNSNFNQRQRIHRAYRFFPNHIQSNKLENNYSNQERLRSIIITYEEIFLGNNENCKGLFHWNHEIQINEEFNRKASHED